MNPVNYIQSWFRHNTGFNKSIPFILGLIWSFKMVEKTFLNTLITRLAAGKTFDLRSSVLAVNSLELISIVLVVISTYATKVCKGHFLMVAFPATVFVVAFILNFPVAGNDDEGQLSSWLFYPAMALARAALAVTLKAFLDDQLRPKYQDENEREQHTKFWWTMVSASAAIFNQVSPLSGFHLKKLAKYVVIAMGCFFVVFLSGFEYYYDDGDRSRSVTLIEKSKRPVNILSLVVCFSILNLVSAAGSTFFLLEAITLAVRDYLPVIILLDNVARLTEFAVSESSSYLLKRLRESKRYNIQKMELVRIGIGMWCCALCCNFAVGVSTHRKYGADGGNMSVYWLIPQFITLGVTRGFAKDGLQSLCKSQASSSYLGELARGVGYVLSILFVFVFRGRHFRWLEKNINSSSLNKYYSFLAVLSVANAMYYCWVAAWYLAWPFLGNDKDKRPRATDSKTDTPQAKPFLEKAGRGKRPRVTHTNDAKGIAVKDRDKRPRGVTVSRHTREGSSWTYNNNSDKKMKGNNKPSDIQGMLYMT